MCCNKFRVRSRQGIFIKFFSKIQRGQFADWVKIISLNGQQCNFLNWFLLLYIYLRQSGECFQKTMNFTFYTLLLLDYNAPTVFLVLKTKQKAHCTFFIKVKSPAFTLRPVSLKLF